MLIYRVENAKRKGPYTSGDDILSKHYKGDSRQPPPERDAELMRSIRSVDYNNNDFLFPTKYKFGFSSLQQARKWLYKKCWSKELRSNDYHLFSFEVPDEHVLVGCSQVLYDSKRVKTSTRKSSCVVESLWSNKKG